MKRLDGKVALVTGAGRGIGRVTALRLAEDGASLALHYSSSAQGAAKTAEMICAKGGTAHCFQADIRKRSEVIAMFESYDERFDRLDIVVNSSGIAAGGPLADLDEEQLETMLGVNLKGPLYVASEASKRMGEGGRIINIGSDMSEKALAGTGIYSATKVALKAMTESWAKELGLRGITVNTVMPGATSPGMAERTSEPWLKLLTEASPFKRIGKAEEIAAVVAFLASPEASWVSGAHILANGSAKP